MDELTKAIASLEAARISLRTAAATSATGTDPSDWASSMLSVEREVLKQVAAVQAIVKRMTAPPPAAPVVRQPMTIPPPPVPPASPPAA